MKMEGAKAGRMCADSSFSQKNSRIDFTDDDLADHVLEFTRETLGHECTTGARYYQPAEVA